MLTMSDALMAYSYRCDLIPLTDSKGAQVMAKNQECTGKRLKTIEASAVKIFRTLIYSRWREMAALDISLSKMASKYSFTQVNCVFSNIFSSISHRSPIWRQRLDTLKSLT